MHYGSGSVIPSRSAGFTNTGSPRPARPGQLDQMMADNIAGGADPAQINEMSHASAAALLDRVHHTQNAELVERVLTLVDREGVDVIAELWSRSEPDSLPGILWRLYVLRTWMRKNRESIARLWRVGEPVATTASAIAGVDQAPEEFRGSTSGKLGRREKASTHESGPLDAHGRQSVCHRQGFSPWSESVEARKTGVARSGVAQSTSYPLIKVPHSNRNINSRHGVPCGLQHL